jgi:hypothetical protein
MNLETLLLRQVNPSFVQGDTISTQVFTSQTFRPSPKDEGKLSVYQGDKFNAGESFDHFIKRSYASAGVVAVSKLECDTEALPVNEDNDPFEGHCSIDYNGLSSGQIDKKAKKLKSYARVRGWLHQMN